MRSAQSGEAAYFKTHFSFWRLPKKRNGSCTPKRKRRLCSDLPGCDYHRRPKGRCALRPLSAQPLPAVRSGILPRSDRRLPSGGRELPHSEPSRVGRSGYGRKTCTAKAGAVSSLSIRATVADSRLQEQGEGCRGPFPAAFLLGCKTLFFPRRKEKGFS